MQVHRALGGGFGESLRSSATLSRTRIAVKEVAPLGDCYQCDSWSFAAETVVQSNLEESRADRWRAIGACVWDWLHDKTRRNDSLVF